MGRALLIALALSASCYDGTVKDCQYLCTGPMATGECPNDMQCNSQGRCVADRNGPACAGLPVDAGSGSGTPIDAPAGSSACPAPPVGTDNCQSVNADPTVAPCFAICSPAETGSDANNFKVVTATGTWWPAHVGSADNGNVKSLVGASMVLIGLRRMDGGSGGSFAWVDGESFDSSGADWSVGAPMSGSGINCVIAAGGGWGAVPCGTVTFNRLISFEPN
jgi:hypothetical protein